MRVLLVGVGLDAWAEWFGAEWLEVELTTAAELGDAGLGGEDLVVVAGDDLAGCCAAAVTRATVVAVDVADADMAAMMAAGATQLWPAGVSLAWRRATLARLRMQADRLEGTGGDRPRASDPRRTGRIVGRIGAAAKKGDQRPR